MNYRELKRSPKCNNVNGIPIVELQCFASRYDVDYLLYSVELPEGEMGYIFKVNNIYEVYLSHCLQRQIVLSFCDIKCHKEYEEDLSDDNKAAYFGLLDERDNIVKSLESLLATDRDAVYLVLLHEIGHKELGHPIPNVEESHYEEIPLLPPERQYNEYFFPKFLKQWRRELDAENWAIAEFKKLKGEGML